jgi:hypothetical protein
MLELMTGKYKVAVHDEQMVLEKVKTQPHNRRGFQPFLLGLNAVYYLRKV